MSPADCLTTAFRALGVNKLRSFLTILGIIVGVGAVISMASVAAGSQAEVAEKIRTLGANLLLVMPGAQISNGARQEVGTRHTWTEDDAAAIQRELPDVQVAAPLLARARQIVVGNKNLPALVAGINTDYLIAREWRIARGRSFNSTELLSGAKTAIIGTSVAEQLFATGDGIGETVRVGDVPFTVIGVLDSKGQGTAGRSQDERPSGRSGTRLGALSGLLRLAARPDRRAALRMNVDHRHRATI